MTITDGTEVSLEYTLKLEDKTVVDSNLGAAPLSYTHGSNQIVAGLEKELAGMEVGDTKQVVVSPEEGYGPVEPQAIQEIPAEQIPPEARKVGTQLQGQNPEGNTLQVQVVEVKDHTVVIDFNHPLAGKTLYFDVKVVDIQKPSAQSPV